MPREGYHLADCRERPLCETEKVLLLYVAQGYRPREIAQILYVHPHTVKNRLSTIREKLEAKSTIHAVYRFFVEATGSAT